VLGYQKIIKANRYIMANSGAALSGRCIMGDGNADSVTSHSLRGSHCFGIVGQIEPDVRSCTLALLRDYSQ